jgi:hypothetical protein
MHVLICSRTRREYATYLGNVAVGMKVMLVGVLEDREQWRAVVTTVVNLSTRVWRSKCHVGSIICCAVVCIATKTCKSKRVISGPCIYSIHGRNERGPFSVNDAQCYGIISTLLQSTL